MLTVKTAVLAAALLAGATSAHPSSKLTDRQGDTNACARIRDETADFDWFYDLARGFPTVRPSLAYSCLRSVKASSSDQVALLDYIKPGLDFHSTLTQLKAPPEGYLSQGVNILAGFDQMKEKVEKGEYETHYDYVKDLYVLMNVRPRDGHLSYVPALMDIFSFESGASFVSVSKDGRSRPEIYLYDDVEHEAQDYTPSPVKSINGEPADDFILQSTVNVGPLHDPDARYNNYMRSLALDYWLTYRSSGAHLMDMPDTFEVELENGTTVEYDNVAHVQLDFEQIDSGEALHALVEKGDLVPEFASGLLTADERFEDELGYPRGNMVFGTENVTAGYLFERGDLEDVAVVTVRSFSGSNMNTSDTDNIDSFDSFDEVEFALEDIAEDARASAEVIVNTIKAAKEDGKKRLVLDLQGNPGGFPFNLFVVYLTLFPEAEFPWRYRARATEQLEWLGEIIDEALGSLLSSVEGQVNWPLGIQTMVRDDGEDFDDFEDMFGPDEIDGEKYTKLARDAPLDKPGAYPDMYEWDRPWTRAPYDPKDIVIVTDGNCHSGCGFLVGALAREHGVRTVALGGRPIEAPMQAIGGTKGGPSINLLGISSLVEALDTVGERPEFDTVPGTRDTAPLKNAPPLSDFSMNVNLGNVHPSKSSPDVPVQFMYEAANCKLFYTWDMLRDAQAMWRAVADVAWGGAKCVKGSTTNGDDTMGDKAPGYSKAVADTQKLVAGPGDPETTPEDEGAGNVLGGGWGRVMLASAGCLLAWEYLL